MTPRNPTEENRILVLGRTGSGKTVFSFRLFSTRNWTEIPWIVLDYKKDRLFTKLLKEFKGRVKEIQPADKPPSKPGIYIMRPVLQQDDQAVEDFLMAVYRKGDIGLYLDEGYAVPQRVGLDAILTQGRSLSIPVIALYQRPVWMTRFATSQADFIAIFHLKEFNDRKKVDEMIGDVSLPNGRIVKASVKLPQYHCLWHDVSRDESYILRPAPPENVIMQTFRERLGLAHRNDNSIGRTEVRRIMM